MRALGCGGACDGCLGLLGASGRPPDKTNSKDESPNSLPGSSSDENSEMRQGICCGSVDDGGNGKSSLEDEERRSEEPGCFEETIPVHSHPLVGPGQSVAVSRTARATQR